MFSRFQLIGYTIAIFDFFALKISLINSTKSQMTADAILAKGENYFFDGKFPLAVKEVNPDKHKTHPYDLTFQNHYHDFNEIVVITRGDGLHVYQGYEVFVQKGDVFLLRQGEPHHFVKQNKMELFNIMYENDRVLLPFNYLNALNGYRAFFELEPYARKSHQFQSHLVLDDTQLLILKDQIFHLQKELFIRQEGYQALSSSLLTQIIVHICRSFENVSSPQGKALLRVSETIKAMEKDFAYQWTLEELAKKVFMSENNFLLLFKEATQQSPLQYLNQYRLKHSQLLLSRTFQSITEVALNCGFNDGNYFTRLFKREVGLTPSQFRKMGKNPKI